MEPLHGKNRLRPLMDKPLPARCIVRKKSPRIVRPVPAIVHLLSKGDVDPLNLIDRTCILRHDAPEFRFRLRTHALVRIHIEHPVCIRLRQCKIALCGKIPRQGTLNDARSLRSREFCRTVCALIVDDENLISKRRTLDARLDMLLLIVREYDYGKLHTTTPLYVNPCSVRYV